MSEPGKTLRSWFVLTRQEQGLAAAVLALALLGLVARCAYVRSQAPETYAPPGLAPAPAAEEGE